MDKMFARWATVLLLASLAACGGGGGDAGGSPAPSPAPSPGPMPAPPPAPSPTPTPPPPPAPALVFTPSSLAANVLLGQVGTVSLSATLQNPDAVAGPLYIDVAGADATFAADWSLAPSDATHFAVTLHPLANLARGHHTGHASVVLCHDAGCVQPYSGDPFGFDFDIDVEPAPLSVTPDGATASTVHWGGPSTESVAISINGAALKWSATPAASWLAVDHASGTGPAIIHVRFTPTTALGVGDFASAVTIATEDGQSSTLPFALHVLPAAFTVTGGVPAFDVVNGAPVAPQSFQLGVDSGASAGWAISSDAAWMNVTASGTSTPATATLQPMPAVGPLASGSYQAHLTITNAAGDVTSSSLSSRLTLETPQLAFSVPSVTLGGVRGRDLAGAQSARLQLNTGTNGYPWSAIGAPAWLQASASGSVAQAGTTLNFAPLASEATPGSTSAALTYTSTVNGDRVTTPLTVNLNVDIRRLLPSAWGVGLSASPTGSVLSRTIRIRDNFGGHLAWSATSDRAWLAVTSSGDTDTAQGLVITANPSTLADGATDVATVTVSTPDGAAPAVLRVGLFKTGTGLAAMQEINGHGYKHIAADPVRPLVYVNAEGSSVDVYHAVTGALVATVANVGSNLAEMSASPDGRTLYVVDTGAQQIARVDLMARLPLSPWTATGTLDVYQPIVATRPNGVEVVVAGTHAYANGNDLGATGLPGYGGIAATLDGATMFANDTGTSPSSQYRMDSDYSEIAGGTYFHPVMHAPFDVGGSSNGQDIAISPDGSATYVASGAPYACMQVNPSTLNLVGFLPGGNAYPINVEVTSDGRPICSNTDQFWVHTRAGVLASTWTNPYDGWGYILARSLHVTPDGFVVLMLSQQGNLALVPIGG